MPVVVERLLQLASLFKHVPKVGVGLGQHGVLLDGQRGEVCRLVVSPALEVYGGEEKENSCVGGVLSPELHRVFLRILIIPRLKKINVQTALHWSGLLVRGQSSPLVLE